MAWRQRWFVAPLWMKVDDEFRAFSLVTLHNDAITGTQADGKHWLPDAPPVRDAGDCDRTRMLPGKRHTGL
jgi:hypothetical protein